MFVSRTRLLEILDSKDYISFGNIDYLNWKEITKTCEDAVVNNPQYWCSLVPEQSDSWDEIGDNYFDSISHFKDWGYTSSNTTSWETTATRPQLSMDWESYVLERLPITNSICRPTLQKPGNIMPWHNDKFFNFKRNYPNQKEFVVRFIIFINDWTPGQFIQAGNSVIKGWQAGDIVLWHPTRMHLAVNAGYANKWTTNITGILDEEIYIPYNIAKDIL